MAPAREFGKRRGDDAGQFFAMGIAIEISLGVAGGVAIQNIPVGIGCGVALGVGIGSLLRKHR